MGTQLIANELLAFLQQKLDVMDEVSAIQICASNFSEEDIAAAKLLLFTTLNKRDKMVSRRRDGTKKSIQDIITLLKETDPDDVPTFVAKELHKLPPVTFDHVDVTSLLKDIVSLKASLVDVVMKLDAFQNTVTDLRKEIYDLRNEVSVSRSTSDASNVNTCRRVVDLPSLNSASAYSTPAHPSRTVECSAPAPPTSAPAPVTSPCDVARTARPVPLPRPAAPVKTQRRNFASVTASTAVPKTKFLPKDTGNGNEDDEGFVKVQRKKRATRTQNRSGTAPKEPTPCLRAARPTTPVYVSRLHYLTKKEDVETYICKRTKYQMRVQLLEARRNVGFKSFVVRVPNDVLPLLMKEDFWPVGVVFRRFRGLIPQDSTKDTVLK
ncbi:uncharacterized protein LOC142985928 [Anticarsia gemmatalis]|uniref:uncharacterized protein LOC142985928 n=1 Tax=Anticarsia gemmatalis TaxID=129554 RepID=UPI003F76A66C